MNMNDEPEQPTFGERWKTAPRRTGLGILIVVNWFVFGAIAVAAGGLALGTTPSVDGFVLTNHGRMTPVSEAVWLWNLVYGYATLFSFPVGGACLICWLPRSQKDMRTIALVVLSMVAVVWWVVITSGLVTTLRDYIDLCE